MYEFARRFVSLTAAPNTTINTLHMRKNTQTYGPNWAVDSTLVATDIHTGEVLEVGFVSVAEVK
jgi:hypothetical protein